MPIHESSIIKEINSLNKNLIVEVVDKHLETFKESISSKLGRGYVEYFYKRLIISESSAFFACLGKNNKLLGFIGGTLNSSRFYDFHHKKKIMRCLLLSLMHFKFPPKDIYKMILRYRFTIGYKIGPELLSLIVGIGERKKGIGRNLVASLCNYFLSKDKMKWKVFTEGLMGYNFYSKLNLEKMSEFKVDGNTSFFVEMPLNLLAE
jgi:hypothetical protein